MAENLSPERKAQIIDWAVTKANEDEFITLDGHRSLHNYAIARYAIERGRRDELKTGQHMAEATAANVIELDRIGLFADNDIVEQILREDFSDEAADKFLDAYTEQAADG